MQMWWLCLHHFSYLLTLTHHTLPKPQIKPASTPHPLLCHHWQPYNPPAGKIQETEDFSAGYFFRMNITSQKSWPISSRCSQESIWPKMFHNEMNCCFAVITEWKFTIPVIHLVHNITKALFENVKCSGGAKYYRYENSSSFCVRLYVSSL